MLDLLPTPVWPFARFSVRHGSPPRSDQPARCARAGRSRRRGISTIWLILMLPAALCLLGVVVEAGNLWLARVELTNALEAAALAAVDQWGDAGVNTPASRTAARIEGVALAAANTVSTQPVMLLANGGGPAPNDNAAYSGNVVILGAYNPATREFNGLLDPATAGYDLAVRARATVAVNSILGSYCGVSMSPFDITTQATARYDGNQPKLVRVDTVIP